MDNPTPSSVPAKNPPITPEDKLLRTRTLLEKYGKYFPLIPPLFLILVLAGVYFATNNNATPSQSPQLQVPTHSLTVSSPTPNPTENPTANWKTYRNEKLRIEFKFPEMFNSHKVEIKISNNTLSLIFHPNPANTTTWTKLLDLTLDKTEFIKYDELESCKEVGTPEYHVPCLDDEITNLYIQGYNMRKITVRDSDTTWSVFAQTLQEPLMQIEYGGDEKFLSQFLSTFKFLDQSFDISGWKSFTINGYSLKYPSDWKVGIIDYLHAVSITNSAGTVEIKISDSNYPFRQSGPVEATSKFIQLETFDTMYTVEETIIDNSSAYIGFKTDTIPPLYIIFGTGYPASGEQSLKDYENSKSTILKILSTFKFTQ